MNKLGLIIRREYLTRVTKRSFILATIITPFAFAIFFAVVALIFSYESDDQKRVAVVDEAEILKGALKDETNLHFKFVEKDLKTARENFDDEKFDGILHIPAIKDTMARKHTIYFYADDQLSLDIQIAIRERIGRAIREFKIEALDLDRARLQAINTSVELDPRPLSEKGKDASSLTSIVAAGIGGIMGFIMYITVFVYGVMVMRSVMEEKTSRIVEVMISSVKPFQLMLGKIIGVGAVGLTQVAAWSILIPLLMFLVRLIFQIDPTAYQASLAEGAGSFDPDDAQAMAAMAMVEINNINWWAIFPLFILYFLGGFFLYSSLFAAVGSAIGDDTGEGQSLTIPITIPVILALYIMMVTVMAPNSSLAVWSSMFPLFSPIVMPARLAFGPPVWEVILSMSILIGTALFFIWLSGRIYRVGILMYGKKSGFKELAKWIFYRD